MSVKQRLNVKYAEYCKELGNLQFKRHCLDTEISNLLKKIEKLNELQPELLEALNERESGNGSHGTGLSTNQSGGIGEANEEYSKGAV